MTVYTDVKKDSNSVAVMCGVSDFDGSVMPIQIDPVTGGILAAITVVSDDIPVVVVRALKDQNGAATIIGASDTSGVIVPSMYHVNSQLFADVIAI
jgi:hypothetical protein